MWKAQQMTVGRTDGWMDGRVKYSLPFLAGSGRVTSSWSFPREAAPSGRPVAHALALTPAEAPPRRRSPPQVGPGPGLKPVGREKAKRLKSIVHP